MNTKGFSFVLWLIVISIIAFPTMGEVVFEDDFMGDSVDGQDPMYWQWWQYADLVWADEADDVPEHGPGVLVLGGDGGGGTVHIGLEADEVKSLTDYRVTVLFVDRLISGEEGDSDFHIGIRCQEYDPFSQDPENCYEVEYDGDDNGPRDVVPEDGPTSFFIFTRGGDAELRGEEEDYVYYATRDVVPRPVSNQWYWLSIQAVGNVIRAKVWRYEDDEPDWILTAEDPLNEFPSGGVRIGTWSGIAHVAYVKVETVEEAAIQEWPIH